MNEHPDWDTKERARLETILGKAEQAGDITMAAECRRRILNMMTGNNMSIGHALGISNSQVAKMQGTQGGLQAAVQGMMDNNTDNTRVVFDGRVKVTHVANGFIVEINNGRGREVSIAKDIKEVNEILAAAMVSFRLEDRE